jgi:hypothetical protein
VTDYIDRIGRMGACREALVWLGAEGHPDLPSAWAACPYADWLLWLAAQCATPDSAEHRDVVLAAAECAITVLHRVPAGEDRPARAIEAARRWARGEATAEECRLAAIAADAAARAAYAAAYAAAAAADAAYAAAYAADAAARAAAARAASRADTAGAHDLANVVRQYVACPVLLGGAE